MGYSDWKKAKLKAERQSARRLASPEYAAVAIAQGKVLPDWTDPGSDGAHVRIDVNGMVLLLTVTNPTKLEIDACAAPMAMKMLEADHSLLFLLRFGDLPWMDAPFSIHRVGPELRVIPAAPATGHGWMLTAILVNRANGVVAAIRQLALSNHFSTAVSTALVRQLGRDADDEAHQREVTGWRRELPDDLAAKAVDASFRQGDHQN